MPHELATGAPVAQKGAHHKIAFGRGLAWYAGQGLKGTTADCTHAVFLIEGLSAQYLFADRGMIPIKLLIRQKVRG